MKHNAILLLCTAALFQSCLGMIDAPKGQECDIVQICLHLEDPNDYFYHAYDTLQRVRSDEYSIRFTIKTYAQNLHSVPVSISITRGAKAFIRDEQTQQYIPFTNGQKVDFSNMDSRQLHIVSEDGNWHRNYQVSIVKSTPSAGDFQINPTEDEDGNKTYFLDDKGKYYCFGVSEALAQTNLFNTNPQAGNRFTWCCGNPGFLMAKSGALATEYPTIPGLGEAVDGKDCIHLITRETGSFGKMVNMCIASGSLFNGQFDVSNALKNALKATIFGNPIQSLPQSMSVWLKWKAGENVIKGDDRRMPILEGIIDEPDVYLVVYRNQDEEGHQIRLDGNDILNSPYIVGKARLPHHYNSDGTDQPGNNPIHGLTDEWKKITLNVEYTQDIDPEILANRGYSMAISFASSWQGGYFRGALGSQLSIGEITLETKR